MTLEIIKAPDTAPTNDIDHLVNHLAVIVRATKAEYGLTEAQQRICYDRAMKIIDANKDKGIFDRVIGAKDPFWKAHSDTVLKYLHDTGILVDTLGI